MSDKPENHDSRRESAGHEPSGASVRFVVVSSVALVLLVAVVLVLMWPLHDWFVTEKAATPDPTTLKKMPVVPPEPRLQRAPQQDYDSYFAAQQRHLQTYGRVDEKQQIVRIPIERAIDLVVEKGLPHQPRTPNKISND